MRKFRLTLTVAVAVAMLATATGVSSGADAPAGPSARTSAAQTSTSLTSKQKKAKQKALKNCARKATSSRRKACRKSVNRRFRPKPVQPDKPVTPDVPAVTIDVRDDYFTPDVVNIQSGDSILWVWDDLNHDPHNVTMVTGPPGVDRLDFQTASSPAVGVTFTRKFTVPGTYTFRCSLHVSMGMTVTVS